MKTRFLGSFVLILTVLQSLAQNETKTQYSLAEAQDYAVEHNYDMVNAQYAVNAAVAQVGETRAAGLPQISGELTYQHFLNLATSLIPGEIFGQPGEMVEAQFGTPMNSSFTLKANQLIFSGSYIVALRSSAAYKQMSELTLQKTKAETRNLVRQAYVAVLVSRESILVLDSMLKTTQENLKHIDAMYKAGLVEETDASQVKLLVSTLMNQLNTARLQENIAVKMLQYRMGMPLTGDLVLTDNVESVMNSIDKSAYLQAELTLEDNINYAQIKNAERISELLLLLEKSAYLPTLSAYISQGYNANRNEFNFFSGDEKWYQTSVWGLTLSIPIFSGGERYYKVKRAKIELEQARNNTNQASDMLKLEFATARNTYNTMLANLQNAIEAKQIAHTIYVRSLVKFEKGIIASTDLLQNHNQYLEKETAYFDSLQKFLTAQSELERILTKVNE